MSTGYNIYRGAGGLSSVDFDTAVETAAAGASSASLAGLGHTASQRYTYVVRPVLDDLETPDVSCICEVEMDSDADWVGARPEPVLSVRGIVKSGGQLQVEWHYRKPYGAAAPNDFGVYYSTTPNISRGSPNATVDFTTDGRYTRTFFSLTDKQTYYVGVTARTAAGIESALIEAGPYVADDSAPDTPGLLADTTHVP